MPIKMLKFSFSLPVEAVLEAAAKYNTSLDIEAYREATDQSIDVSEPLALEDQSPGSLRDIVIGRLRQSGNKVTGKELRQLAIEHGHTSKQLGNLLYVLVQSKLVSRPARGTYRITKRGMAY